MNQTVLQTLKELENSRDSYWNITPEVGQFLNKLIIDNSFKNIIEIGTSTGYSGIWIAEALSQLNDDSAKLTTIESHKERFELAKQNFASSTLSKFINQILGHAPEAIPVKQNYDLAFLDATKYEHLSYFQKLKDQINLNGYIIADNILSHKEQLKDFVKTIQKEKYWSSKILDIGTGLLISQKIN